MADGLYQYDTLPQGRWFRILKIHPGHFDDPLSCELVSTSLDEAPRYRALSYVWGDPGQVASITCSGFRREITVSLFEGLRRIRGTDGVEIAWADAICINQADNKEKSSQVNQMGDIYDKAAEVIVWLGHDTDGIAEVAFNGLRQVNKSIIDKTVTTWSPVSSEEIEVVFESSGPPLEFGQTMVQRNTLPSILNLDVSNAIKKLYQLPWFTRVWILQEVGLATIATAFWGSSHIDFQQIGEFIYFAMVYRNLVTTLRQDVKDVISGSPHYALHNVWSTYDKQDSWVSRSPVLSAQVVEWLKENTKIDFILVLEASRRLNATNHLDHVFAFLGHPKATQPGTNKTLIQADYNTDMETLNRSLASKLAETSLNFLVQVQIVAEDIEPENAKPSWIPQWHINNPEAPIAFWEAWDASLAGSMPPTTKRVASVCGNTLKASALLFDTVRAHTPTMKSADFEHPLHQSAAMIEQCWDLAASRQSVYEHALIALAATLRCYNKSKATTESELRDLGHALLEYCGVNKPGMLEGRMKSTIHNADTLSFVRKYVYGEYFKEYGTNRRFFTSVGGYFGLGPSCMEQGDVCAILFGADVPLILRPTETGGTFRLVGQAYMHGVMYGEVVKKWDACGEASGWKNICIV